jgi:hypothetical protein
MVYGKVLGNHSSLGDTHNGSLLDTKLSQRFSLICRHIADGIARGHLILPTEHVNRKPVKERGIPAKNLPAFKAAKALMEAVE